MPKGTRVSRCVDKVKKSKDEGAAIAICQASTKQGYASGKKLQEAVPTVLLKIGKVVGGLVKKRAAKKAITGPEGVATGGDTAKKQAELGQQAASDKDLEENKMKNAYVRKLMEDEEPTDKDLKDIKKEKPDISNDAAQKAMGKAKKASTPKEIKTAIAGHQSDIKKAGKAAVEKGDKADEKEISRRVKAAEQQNAWTEYHRIGALMAEALGLSESQFKTRPGQGQTSSGERKAIESVRRSKTMEKGKEAFKVPPMERTPKQQKDKEELKSATDAVRRRTGLAMSPFSKNVVRTDK